MGTKRVAAVWVAAALVACGAPHEQAHVHQQGQQPAHRDEPTEHQGPVGHRFENADEWASRFESPDRDGWQRPADVIAAMAIEPGMTVADIGAGTGYFEPHLSRAVGQGGAVLALDVEPDMVRYLKERAEREGLANVEARLVAFDDPGLPEGAVDRVLIVDTWHHIADRGAYAQKLKHGLAAGGALYVVDFTMETQHGPPPAHRLESTVVAEELRSAGFEVRVDTEVLSEQYIVIAR